MAYQTESQHSQLLWYLLVVIIYVELAVFKYTVSCYIIHNNYNLRVLLMSKSVFLVSGVASFITTDAQL